MKRYIAFVVFVSLLPFISIFITALHPHTQDGLVHLARMAAYVKALKDGEFLVRWAGYLNYGYGMPLFDFIYPFPYLISSVFLFTGISLVPTYKIVLLLSFVFSGVCMFLFANELFQDKKKALFVSIFYQFAQFHLVELFVRGDIGEIYTYTFLPLVCYGLVKISKKITLDSCILTSVATFLLILSHNSLSLTFFTVTVFFVFFLSQSKKSFFYSFSCLGIGLLLSLFYWLPALSDHNYTFGDLFMKNLYLHHFAPLQLFFIPNIFNNPTFRIGGVPIQIGIFHTVTIVIALFVLSTKTITVQAKKIFIFSLVLLLASFFFMQPISQAIWVHSSLLRQFQFPWRFMGVVVFATSLLSVSWIEIFSRKIIFFGIFLFLVVVCSYWYWGPTYGWDRIDEAYYWNFPLTSTYYGETDVIWTQGQATSYPKSPVSFVAGGGTISNFWKNSFKHTFVVNARTTAVVVDRTDYFPGWKVYVNGKQTPIQFQDINYRGQITFTVGKGKSFVEVIFTETPIRLFADYISFISFIGLGIVTFFRKKLI